MQARPRPRAIAAALILSAAYVYPAHGRTICTIAADAADGRILSKTGECGGRYTPASTFKIAISLMGFDAGILNDGNSPTWHFQKGYPDWGGAPWLEPATPARWMKYSIIWYSQQIAGRLGQARFQDYISRFHYGNEDGAGVPGKHNGTQTAWINASLRISPEEQVGFLRKLVRRELPVSAHAYDMTARILDLGTIGDGWQLYGKTGAGSPGDRGLYHYDRDHAYGWFVGWATKGRRQVVFARLIQDEQATSPSPGLRARAELIEAFPRLVGEAGGQ